MCTQLLGLILTLLVGVFFLLYKRPHMVIRGSVIFLSIGASYITLMKIIDYDEIAYTEEVVCNCNFAPKQLSVLIIFAEDAKYKLNQDEKNEFLKLLCPSKDVFTELSKGSRHIADAIISVKDKPDIKVQIRRKDWGKVYILKTTKNGSISGPYENEYLSPFMDTLWSHFERQRSK